MAERCLFVSISSSSDVLLVGFTLAPIRVFNQRSYMHSVFYKSLPLLSRLADRTSQRKVQFVLIVYLISFTPLFQINNGVKRSGR